MKRKKARSAFGLILVLTILALTSPQAFSAEEAKEDSPAAPNGQPAEKQEEKVRLLFKDVDLRVLVQFMAKLTGKNYVVSDKVTGRVTVISPRPVTLREAEQIFQSVLEVHEFTTVRDGEVIKVVPVREARRQGVALIPAGKRPPAGSEEMITQMVTLHFASVNELKNMLVPIASRYAHISAYPETNALIITDVASNVRRLVSIAEALDRPGVARQVRVVPLDHASAKDTAQALLKLFARTTKTTRPTKGPVPAAVGEGLKVLPDERTNSLILLGSQAEIARAIDIIADLDQPEKEGQFNIHVIYLKYAVAEDLAEVLNDLASGATTSSTTQKKAAPSAPQPFKVLSGEIRVVAEPATNSLIVSAAPQEFKVIQSIVAKLDIPRTMVYVEAAILEMSTSKSLEFGIKWSAGAEVGDTLIFGTQDGPVTVPTEATPGLQIGVLGPTISFAGLEIPSISALLKAVQTDTDIRIVATPQILTADNEEATVQVAKNLPFVTRMDQGVDSTERTVQVFEYRDVGYTLKVTPRISGSGIVRLSVEAEAKAVVKEQVTDSQNNVILAPTTTVRQAQTVVVTRDDEMIVIGGLIGSDLQRTGSKVPCLGNIPVAGWAFKTTDDKGTQTNLLIFLSPHILASQEEIRALSEEKLEKSRQTIPAEETDFISPYRPKMEESDILTPPKQPESK